MTSKRRKFIVTVLATFTLSVLALTTNCGGGVGSSSSVQGKTSIPPGVIIAPIYRYKTSGFAGPSPSVKLVNGHRLDSDGALYKTYTDGSEVMVFKFTSDWAGKIAAKLNTVGDADGYELKDNGDPAICDLYYSHELYIGGAWVKVEEQQDCGPHLTLQLKDPNNPPSLDSGEISILYAVEVVEKLVDGVIGTINFVQ